MQRLTRVQRKKMRVKNTMGAGLLRMEHCHEFEHYRYKLTEDECLLGNGAV
jgi:hypothetical protein